MKYYDLFGGIGGFSLALDSLGHERVGGCEWNKYARIIYGKHFEEPDYDAEQLDTKQLPDFDILTAGFPCQAFSIAGKRLGFEDTRGNIFFQIARIARDKQPTYLFLENVRGLLSHNKGETFKTILETLDELGYDVEWQICNTKYFLPQTRERVFIIGHFRGRRTRKIFPIQEGSSTTKTKKLIQIGNVDTKGHNSLWGRVYHPDGIAPTLNAVGGGLGAKTGLFIVNDRGKWRNVDNSTAIDANYWKGVDNHAQRTMVLAWSKSGRDWGTEYRLKVGEANTLNTGDGCKNQSTMTLVIDENSRVRKLMPIECERLQGFPDDWTIGLSDTQRYKCIGNAVTVPVVRYLAERLFKDNST